MNGVEPPNTKIGVMVSGMWCTKIVKMWNVAVLVISFSILDSAELLNASDRQQLELQIRKIEEMTNEEVKARAKELEVIVLNMYRIYSSEKRSGEVGKSAYSYLVLNGWEAKEVRILKEGGKGHLSMPDESLTQLMGQKVFDKFVTDDIFGAPSNFKDGWYLVNKRGGQLIDENGHVIAIKRIE